MARHPHAIDPHHGHRHVRVVRRLARTGRPAMALSLVLTLGALATPSPIHAGTDPAPPTTINEFLPAERDLSDCLSVLPKPGCGSKARGGWRQGAVFGAVVVGLGVIGTRIAIGVRRRDRQPVEH